MDFSLQKNTKYIGLILLILAVTQAAYTAIFITKIDLPTGLIWGLEGVLFALLAALGGAALVQAKSNQIGWSAIAFSAPLNLVQVSIGLAMFAPFFEAAGTLETLDPLKNAVVAFSFMIYYAAKILLGFAALTFGLALKQSGKTALGGLTALVGGVAMLANALLVLGGRDGFLPSAIGGGSGVAATLLLALCLLSLAGQDDQG